MDTTGTPIENNSYRARLPYFGAFFRFLVSLAIVVIGLSILAIGVLRFYRPYLYKYPFFQDVYGEESSLAYREALPKKVIHDIQSKLKAYPRIGKEELRNIGLRIQEKNLLSFLIIRLGNGDILHESYNEEQEDSSFHYLKKNLLDTISLSNKPILQKDHYIWRQRGRLHNPSKQNFQDIEAFFAWKEKKIGDFHLPPKILTRFHQIAPQFYQNLRKFLIETSSFAGGILLFLGSFLFVFGVFRLSFINHLKNTRKDPDEIIPQEPKEFPASFPKETSFEQERWSLPGFQSVFCPIRRVSSHDFNPYGQYHGGTSSRESLHQLQYYDFTEMEDCIDSMNSIESFVKRMLIGLVDKVSSYFSAEYTNPSSATACLRNQEGDYYSVLQYSGRMFVSQKTARLKDSSSWERIIHAVEKGNYLVLRNGEEMVFPLVSQAGTLGLIHFHLQAPISDRNLLKQLWEQIRKYGEQLLHVCVYERTHTDPESTLFNGIRFQEDLAQETARRGEKSIPPQLILIQIKGKLNQESALLYGMLLRKTFPFPASAYRIGREFFAILTAEIPSEGIDISLEMFLAQTRQRERIHLCAGSAVPGREIRTPQDWFLQAQRALTQALEKGWDQHQASSPPRGNTAYLNTSSDFLQSDELSDLSEKESSSFWKKFAVK